MPYFCPGNLWPSGSVIRYWSVEKRRGRRANFDMTKVGFYSLYIKGAAGLTARGVCVFGQQVSGTDTGGGPSRIQSIVSPYESGGCGKMGLAPLVHLLRVKWISFATHR